MTDERYVAVDHATYRASSKTMGEIVGACEHCEPACRVAESVIKGQGETIGRLQATVNRLARELELCRGGTLEAAQ